MSETHFEEESFRSSFNGKTTLRILSLLKPYPLYTIGFMVAIIINGLADSTQFYLFKELSDKAVIARNFDSLASLIRIFFIVFGVECITVFAFVFFAGMLGESITLDLRKKLFAHLQTLSLSYYSTTPVGWIMSRVTQDVNRIADIVTWGLIDFSFAIVSIITAIYYMVRINAKLAGIVVIILPVLIWCAWEFRRRILDQYREVRKINSQITGAFNENISGIRVIKSFGQENKNFRNFAALSGEYFKHSYKAALLNAFFLPSIQILASLAMIFVILYSGKAVSIGTLTIGGVQAFINYIFSIVWPVQDLARVYGELQQSIAAAERVFSLEDMPPAIQDRTDSISVPNLRSPIHFENVSFWYDDGNGEVVLDDFDLDVNPGETIALVGATGGGKSTIVNLLCRFYEPKLGRILFGETDYTRIAQQDIQSHIGIVLQTPHLFSGTIRDNIRYGRLDASEESIIQAAKTAGAYDFIQTLPNRFDEQVGEGGSLLSVGQKQLISLARAILTDPDIFIMDEATSSVDTLTETLIQKGMNTVMRDRTSFVIAHRLSTIRSADRILVIEKGKIAEIGTHTGLLKQKGKYYELYTRQFREEKEKLYTQEIQS